MEDPGWGQEQWIEYFYSACVWATINKLLFSFLRAADALSAVLTKINRLDIVTLLEGPIFDYGNISGTRCFADDSAVSQEQADGKV